MAASTDSQQVALRHAWRTVAARLYAVAATVRRVIGVPDYARYLEHTRRCHPAATPLTEREFARDALTRRYSTPGNRCC